ncbi:hypothetical protein C1645_730692 [Glomus cerebriforme]|uniref:Uncharacterized protein n=1 Tax=Glomus cerebriforme TaxID=658196 RepID=A0A397TX96_9GLOM|nr:hypothetical protein C1645_730692 [Glomus cerebriforme]
MKKFLITLFLLFEIILVSSQEHAIKGEYTTVFVRGNLDGWWACSLGATDYASFSVKLANPGEMIDSTFGQSLTYTGSAVTPYTGQVGKGVFVQVVTHDLEYEVPSLACGIFGQQVSYGCDRDVGTGYISPARRLCLLIVNPFANGQKIDVAVSFTSSVFINPPTKRSDNSVSNVESINDSYENKNMKRDKSKESKRGNSDLKKSDKFSYKKESKRGDNNLSTIKSDKFSYKKKSKRDETNYSNMKNKKNLRRNLLKERN